MPCCSCIILAGRRGNLLCSSFCFAIARGKETWHAALTFCGAAASNALTCFVSCLLQICRAFGALSAGYSCTSSMFFVCIGWELLYWSRHNGPHNSGELQALHLALLIYPFSTATVLWGGTLLL
ncbi:hypothetical protein COO60DRAFT_156363 [Scenedesmus sp. NREL 46B-D3]|nr:hypothetical protein COO60DRAFT_156363 [Scenedesmus sp. NREL 46B-D3]